MDALWNRYESFIAQKQNLQSLDKLIQFVFEYPEINAYADEIGYDTEKNFPCNDIKGQDFNPKTSTGGSFVSGDKQLYCVKGVQQKTKLGEDSGVYDDTGRRGCYYQIVTKINIRIPIIENIVGTPALYVTGDTKVFNKSNEDCVIKNE